MIDRFRVQHDLISLDEDGVVNADIAYVDTLTGEKLVEGKIDIEANEYGELETSPLDIVNQAPEFFEEIAKHNGQYDDDMYKQHTINSKAQRLAENLNDEIGDFIQERKLDLEKVSEIEAVIEGIDIDIKNSEIIEYDTSHEDDALMEIEYQYEIDAMVDNKPLKATIDLMKGNSYSDNILSTKTLDEETENSFKDVATQILKDRGFDNPDQDDVFSLVSKIEEKIENQLKEDQKPKEPKKKRNRGFGMSM